MGAKVLTSSQIALASLTICIATAASAQQQAGFGTCVPMRERAGRDVGCFIISEQKLGHLGAAPVFWHVTRFPSRSLAEAANDSRGTVIEAYGHAWLLEIAGAKWRAGRGTHVAAIGPLPIDPRLDYSALYMEASMRPGMKSAVHRHSGPEAWYALSGETCLETPKGTQVGRANGRPVIVPGGLPMELTATGKTLRKSLVVILHDSSQPPSTMEKNWKPRGLCGTN
jgi:quercetin dioxygenase-like cupin family protein